MNKNISLRVIFSFLSISFLLFGSVFSKQKYVITQLSLKVPVEIAEEWRNKNIVDITQLQEIINNNIGAWLEHNLYPRITCQLISDKIRSCLIVIEKDYELSKKEFLCNKKTQTKIKPQNRYPISML